MDGRSVYQVRKQIGVELARESRGRGRSSCPVPDSGVPAAIGYAQQSGIPFELGIIRSHYVGRTFIQPSDGARHADVKRKHNANRAMVGQAHRPDRRFDRARHHQPQDRADDARSRRGRGAHADRQPADRAQLLLWRRYARTFQAVGRAHGRRQAMADFIKADSLAFVSIDGLYRAVGEAGRNNACPQYCDACFTGDYPPA
jgi:amidophosphoribosyltransferase